MVSCMIPTFSKDKPHLNPSQPSSLLPFFFYSHIHFFFRHSVPLQFPTASNLIYILPFYLLGSLQDAELQVQRERLLAAQQIRTLQELLARERLNFQVRLYFLWLNGFIVKSHHPRNWIYIRFANLTLEAVLPT